MKKVLIIGFIFLMTSDLFSQDFNLVGKWTGIDEHKNKGGIEFKPDMTAILYVQGQAMPINEYRVDSTKNPVWIDLIVQANGQEMVLYSLIEFKEKNKIKWEVFPNNQGNRPIKFSASPIDTAIILTREE